MMRRAWIAALGCLSFLVGAVLLHRAVVRDQPNAPLARVGVVREAAAAHGVGTVLAAPERGAYTGAYIEFGEEEDEVTLDKIQAYSELVGRHQAIIAFTNAWGSEQFPSRQSRIVANSGAVPLIFWNPWGREETGKRARFDLEQIAAGRWDDYVDRWAREARAFRRPVLVAWGLEMNGDWFPWSGVFYGGGEPILGSDPKVYKGPETFKRAYRHLVERVRAAGASNVAWVFHANNASFPNSPWNRMASYYPGSEYVDWLAISAYGKQFVGDYWISVESAILRPYEELAAIDSSKPVLLGEWGIGEFPRQGSKGAWIREAFEAMERRMPRLKGAVFWHERWQNANLTYSNLRVNSSLDALRAYRDGVSRAHWVTEPIGGERSAASALSDID